MADAEVLAVATAPGVRAGAIGPVRREIVFEPLHERPAPTVTPETQPDQPERAPKDPVPSRS